MRKLFVVAAAILGFLSMAQPAAAQTPAPGCVVGAKLEGFWGSEWYEVTVKPGPLKEGQCFVGFDGWTSSYDSHVSALRPRGSGPVRRTENRSDREPAAAQTPAAGCVVGAKLEGQYGNNWYEVTVKPGPLKAGWCFVGFDGWGSFWDNHVPELRPRGSGYVTRPVNPVADDPPTPAQRSRSTTSGGAVRDGRYSCGKIVGGGGGFRSFGTFTIRGGQLANSPLPAGWSVVSITNGPRNPRGVTVVKVMYRTTSGNTDMLDCEPA